MLFDMPAVCDGCGTSFPTGFCLSESARMTTIQNCSAGPCPRCGGIGHIQDGTYDFIDGVQRLVKSGIITVDDLIKFKKIVEDTMDKSKSIDELSKDVAKELPELILIWEWVKAHNNGIAAWLSLLSTIIIALIQAKSSSKTQQIINNNVVNYYCCQNDPKMAHPVSTPNSRPNYKRKKPRIVR